MDNELHIRLRSANIRLRTKEENKFESITGIDGLEI